jgi:hypothetical protein
MRMVLPNHPHRTIGEWLHPSISLREIFSTIRPRHKSPSQMNFQPAFATIVGNQAIMQMSAQTLGRTSPSSRIRTPECLGAIVTRSPRFKWSKANLTSRVTFLSESIPPYCGLWWWNFAPSLYPSCFSRVNSGILVNKYNKHLFTSLPFLHRNLLVIPFSTWYFRLFTKLSSS